MIKALIFLYAASQIYLLWRLWNTSESHAARLTRLEARQPVKSEPKAPERMQPKQIWDKEIEGFNPKKPATVLPRSEEEKKARVYTNWEIDSDFKIVG